MDKRIGKNVTVGSIPRNLLLFSVPMLLTNLLQTAYAIISTIWVGNLIGADAVGATAISTTIVYIFIGVAIGGTLATTILVSQYFGANDMEMVKKVVQTSFTLVLILGTLLTVGGILASETILRLMGTPEEIFTMATSYTKITIAGFILQFIVLLIAAILRGIGDTVTPMIFVLISTVISTVLTPFLISGVGPIPEFGLDGAAYSVFIAQLVACIMSIVYLNIKGSFLSINFRSFKIDLKVALIIMKVGIPTVIQQSLISVGMVFNSSFVNSFGAAAVSAYGAASRLDSIAFMPAAAVGMATAALTGQNIGAGKPERVKGILKWSLIMSVSISVIISVFIVSIPDTLLRMFVQERDVLDIGINYLRIEGIGFAALAVWNTVNGLINGSGKTFVTMVFSIIAMWVIRIPLSMILINTPLEISGLWIAIVSSYFLAAAVSVGYYLTGKWKHSSIVTPVDSGVES